MPTQLLGLSQPQDHEHLYNKLLLEHEKLLTNKKYKVDHKKINETTVSSQGFREKFKSDKFTFKKYRKK